MKKFGPKTTKAELIEAYTDLEREYTRLEETVLAFQEGSTVPDSAIKALKAYESVIREALSKELVAVSDGLSEIASLSAVLPKEIDELQKFWGVSFDDEETVWSLLQDYQELCAGIDRKKQVLADQRDQELKELNTKASRDLEDWTERVNLNRLNRDKDLSRFIAEKKYEIETRKEIRELRKKEEGKEFEKSLRASWAENAGVYASKNEALEERRAACMRVANELSEKKRILQEKLEAAKSEALSEAAKAAKYKESKVAAEFESQHQRLKVNIQALENTINRNNRKIVDLQNRLGVISTNVQTLSQTSLNTSARGASKALEVAERIALEQAKVSSGGNKRA